MVRQIHQPCQDSWEIFRVTGGPLSMKDVANITIIVIILVIFVGCAEQSKEVETNKILKTLVKQAKDSTAVYFQKVDSLGEKKIKTVTKPKKPDSVAIYYKSVDSLQFKTPITRKDLHRYELKTNPVIDSLITNSTITQWNQEISHYTSRKWTKKERNNLPILNIKPEYLNGYGDFKSRGPLQKMLYFSLPFFNEEKTKALIYRYKFSYDGKSGQLYILTKNGNGWNVIYNGVTFVSSF